MNSSVDGRWQGSLGAAARGPGHRLVIRGARFPGDVAIEDGVITEIGSIQPRSGDDIIDAAGGIVTAGLVNTHHHLYQWMTRGRSTACGLFDWLVSLYPVWGRLSADDVHAAAIVGLADLALAGCTTAVDHHYLVPAGDVSVFDEVVAAARAVGIRLYLSRGSMDLSEEDGGLPPAHVVEDRDTILGSTEDLVIRYRDDPMINVVVAPCSPFSVTSELMIESAAYARRHGLCLHTHLGETVDEDRYCIERFGRRPLDQLSEWGWIGSDVWFAHGIEFDDRDIARLGHTGTGVAHCPSSNARLGLGTCRVADLRRAGVPVGLGVDGAASNEGGRLLQETRQALFMARVSARRADVLSPIDVMDIATRGGADVLGRPDLGRLEPGAAGDVAVWPADDLADLHDPIAGLVLGPPRSVEHLLVEGHRVVSDSTLHGVDVAAAQRDLAARVRRLDG